MVSTVGGESTRSHRFCFPQVKEVKDILSTEAPSLKAVATVVALTNQAARAHNPNGKIQSTACSVM